MIVYQLTESQYQTLLNELKLEKFLITDGHSDDPQTERLKREIVEMVHRRFHHRVVTAITGVGT